jgi:hypothetical protein
MRRLHLSVLVVNLNVLLNTLRRRLAKGQGIRGAPSERERDRSLSGENVLQSASRRGREADLTACLHELVLSAMLEWNLDHDIEQLAYVCQRERVPSVF